ncbi:MAG TPA: TlpA disulfide reductase family protein [Burkholderiales bacterium]
MPLGRRELLALGGVGALAALAGALVGALGLQSTSGAAALLAYPFQRLGGGTTRLADWDAPVLLCNFWATWCTPCREEIPLLVATRHKYAANGLEVAGIGIDQVDKLRDFSRELGVDYPILIAGVDSSELLRSLGDKTAALPYSVLLDSRRRITYTKLGAWSESELNREIRAAIG